MTLPDVEALAREFEGDLEAAGSVDDLEAVRIRWLGRKGRVKALMKGMGRLPPEERRSFGKAVNALRDEVASRIAARREALERAAREAEIASGWMDPTLPSPWPGPGRLHPITRLLHEVADYFHGLGYTVATGPDIEDEWHNFDALNIPKDHPARDVWDTFYLPGGRIPRTHTSSVQVRTLESTEPPLRIIAPGRCFRHETIDASHGAFFNQVEGLYIDRDVTLGHLKATLEGLVAHLMGRRLPTRFRPAYYPFVEPGLDLDVRCIFCEGAGCSVCGQTGWIEVIPGGMVHPNVLEACGHDPHRWHGFAFGMGFDRMVMIRYGIDDIRRLYDGSLDLVRGT